MIRIPLLSHDKISGRPLRTFTEGELGVAVLPPVQNGDVLVLMEDDATGICVENDILLIRPIPDSAGTQDTGLKPGMLLAWRYGDTLWPVRVTGLGAEGPELQEPPEARAEGALRADHLFGYVLAVVHHPTAP